MQRQKTYNLNPWCQKCFTETTWSRSSLELLKASYYPSQRPLNLMDRAPLNSESTQKIQLTNSDLSPEPSPNGDRHAGQEFGSTLTFTKPTEYRHSTTQC